jgi:hypothetical protein
MFDQARKTSRLVVRYQAPWQHRAWIVLAVFRGRFDGGYNVWAAVQERRELQAQIESLNRDMAALRANVVGAETARQVDSKSYNDVERSLVALQAQVQQQNEELAFYRGIVAPEDGVGSLRVQRLEVFNGAATSHFQLRLVLMQSMRQERTATGGVKIEVVGSQGDQPARLSLTDLGVNARDGELAFSFKYFQKLDTEVTLPEGFQPTSIEVVVRAPHQGPLQQSFPWQVVNTG